MDTVKINHGNTKMIAHRGMSGIEQENTNAAFVAAENLVSMALTLSRRIFLNNNANADGIETGKPLYPVRLFQSSMIFVATFWQKVLSCSTNRSVGWNCTSSCSICIREITSI